MALQGQVAKFFTPVKYAAPAAETFSPAGAGTFGSLGRAVPRGGGFCMGVGGLGALKTARAPPSFPDRRTGFGVLGISD